MKAMKNVRMIFLFFSIFLSPLHFFIFVFNSCFSNCRFSELRIWGFFAYMVYGIYEFWVCLFLQIVLQIFNFFLDPFHVWFSFLRISILGFSLFIHLIAKVLRSFLFFLLMTHNSLLVAHDFYTSHQEINLWPLFELFLGPIHFLQYGSYAIHQTLLCIATLRPNLQFQLELKSCLGHEVAWLLSSSKRARTHISSRVRAFTTRARASLNGFFWWSIFRQHATSINGFVC